MSLTSSSALIPTKSGFVQGQSLLPSSRTHQPSLPIKSVWPIVAVRAAEPAKNPVVSDKPPKQQAAQTASSSSLATKHNAVSAKWSLETWKSKKALQLPEYPNQEDLQSVLRTLDSFPPIVFASEARNLEELIGEAAMGNAFLLQGGDCAESFKEFNANNIRDTFRILLQMGVVLMFGGQMPFAKPRSDSFEEKNGVKLPSYRGDNVNADAFDLQSRTPDPQRLIRAYCQSAATLNLLRAFATGGYAAMQRVTQWNLDFTEYIEQQSPDIALHDQQEQAAMILFSMLQPLSTLPHRTQLPRCDEGSILYSSDPCQ
ncbi:phospho-2-dehydro-3-deoxyheptonate aldolase 1 [Pyrus ussuriensis x Pyrus communis]|uniref:Phospho-2-dehydro-3-deoxyheptonate aldolase n=1 Tax=Pyrus ussuriensis x Pyrus communis TaxID=2448454 RepID=A0A5N5H9P8_9ROSA|nr:phospho-2-dehydro-3-deoxyheptonate aldolase 1 [Pyrus ussuriensis x Pyrus communis]